MRRKFKPVFNPGAPNCFILFLRFLIVLPTYTDYNFFLRFYLFDRERVKEETQAGGVGEGGAGFPQSREPRERDHDLS